MKLTACATAALICLMSTMTTAAMAADSSDAAIPPVHVKVEVTSKYYGSFTQERDVKVNETASFNNISAHHQGVLYQGKCALNADAKGQFPADIDDGVVVKITPVMISPDGLVGADDEVKAAKLIRYNKVNSGVCGEIAFAESSQTSSRSALLYHPNKAVTVDELYEHSVAAGDKDLRVTVSFSQVSSSVN